MKIGILLLLTLLHTVYGKSTDSKGVDVYDDFQNDADDYTDDTDEPEDTPSKDVIEETNMSSEEPPKINTVGQTFEANLNESIQLPCNITGSNPVQIWRKLPDKLLFQAEISMAAGSTMKKLPDGSLLISALQRNDAGEYQCEALVSDKIRPSIEHKLILKVPPQIESLEAKDNVTRLKTGDMLMLTCKVNGYPEAVIAWHKDSNRFDIPGERLKIGNVTRHDAGTYRCLADNKIGVPAFQTINIKVDFKPVIELERLSVSSKNGETKTELKCLVHSEPKASIVWTKDGANIKNSPHTILNNKENKHVLILNDVMDSDFGLYACSASNYLGHSSKSIKLVKTPAIIRFQKSKSEDKNLILTWEIESKTTVTGYEFEFRKKGETSWRRLEAVVRADEDDIYLFQYEFVKNLESGHYETRIKAKNSDGWSDFSHIETFAEVNAKHGHHKSHKKGHKHGKEKQTQEQSTQSSNPVDVPAEHQESDFIKDSSVRGNHPSGCSSIMPSFLVFSIISIAFFQNRLTIRL